jgi:3-oxoacyl-(acyl-carrier-protein) synthase
VTTLHRVVITGLGLQSPLGSTTCNDVSIFFSRLCAGDSGIRQHPNDEITTPVGWVEFDTNAHFSRLQINQLDRVSQLSIVAARQALTMAGYDPLRGLDDELSHQTGVLFGTGMGGAESTELAYAKFFDAPLTCGRVRKPLPSPPP